jgi:hypothetical protein
MVGVASAAGNGGLKIKGSLDVKNIRDGFKQS